MRKKRKSTDRHHIFWYHKDYARGYAKKLRDHWYCVIEIPRDSLHHRIHYEISHIPVPRSYAIKDALRQLELLEQYGSIHHADNIERRLLVLMSLFDCCEPNTLEALRKQYNVVCKFYSQKSPR